MQVLITGPWGSGTTAVTSCLDAAGLPVPGPHFRIDDPRTPNSYEQTEFRAAVLCAVDEHALIVNKEAINEMRTRLNEFRSRFATGSPYAVKLPAAAFVLGEIESVFGAELELIIVMRRSLDEIGATQQRRGWRETLGVSGAVAIESALEEQLPSLRCKVMEIGFDQVRKDPGKVLAEIDRHVTTELDVAGGAKVIRM